MRKNLNDFWSTTGQSGRLTGQTRVDLLFETYLLSSKSKKATMNDRIHAKNASEKAKRVNVTLVLPYKTI